MDEKWMGLILIFAGLFSIAGAVFNWDWYMNHRKAKFLVKILTRTGARIFYGVLGALIAGFGAVVLLKIVAL